MITFSSCFVGIPLPEQFQSSFEKVLKDVKVLNHHVTPVFSGTPHITLYHLGKQTEDALKELASVVEGEKGLFHHLELTIGGLGYFTPHIPRVIFLNVVAPQAFLDSAQIFKVSLSSFSEKDKKEVYATYHPHLTVGRIKSKAGQVAFLKQKSMLEKKFAMVQWKFPVTELAIYGVHTEKLPTHQRKLITIHL